MIFKLKDDALTTSPEPPKPRPDVPYKRLSIMSSSSYYRQFSSRYVIINDRWQFIVRLSTDGARFFLVLPMKSESKQERQMRSLWNVSRKVGRLKTAMVAPLPIRPQMPTTTDKMPSQMVLHSWDWTGIVMHICGSSGRLRLLAEVK